MMLHGAAALMLGSPALAETRQALVIADRALGQEPGQPARDALDVSRALLAAGFDVRRLENPASLPAPPAERPDVMLIYISADLAVDGGGAAVPLSSGAVTLQALAQLYPAAKQQIVLVESCPADPASAGGHEHVAPPLSMPDGSALLAVSPADGGACGASGRLTAQVLAALAAPGVELGEGLHKAGVVVARGAGWAGFTPMAGGESPPPEDGLIVSQPLRPVNQTGPTRIAATQAVNSAMGSGGDVQIFTAAAPAIPLGGDRTARPTAQGLPEPSIIVGNRPDPEGQTTPDTLSGTSVGASYEERKRIRDDDPALFASLLDSGAFDPPEGQIASVIQTELQRMNCYGGTVDGIWGNGSRQAVDRYFQQAGGTPATREPQVALFRQIALKDDLRCPAVVVQPAVRNTATTPSRQNTTSNPRRTTQQPARQPARQQPAAQPPAATGTQPRINPNTLGSGIFR